jgi:hypothetical protein
MSLAVATEFRLLASQMRGGSGLCETLYSILSKTSSIPLQGLMLGYAANPYFYKT